MAKEIVPDRVARVGFSSADGILLTMPNSVDVWELSCEFTRTLRDALDAVLEAEKTGVTFLRIIEP